MQAEPQQPYDFGNHTKKISILMSLTSRAKNSGSDGQSEDIVLKC